MADQLATPEQLASALQQDLDAATANLWLNAGTAVVQEAAGTPPQRILEVEDDTCTLIGTTDAWLYLPQRPVTVVTSVELDGVELSEGTETGTYRVFGSKLWRDVGWAECAYAPSKVIVVNTHGYPTGDQCLELARSGVLGLSKVAYVNIGGARSEKIDDYAVVYEAISAALEASPALKASLRRQYGRGAGLVKIS